MNNPFSRKPVATPIPFIKSDTSRSGIHRYGELVELELKGKGKNPFHNHQQHTDIKRAHIALVFVYGYMIIVTLILIGVPMYNWLALGQTEKLEIDKILSQTGALLGSPLGFVVGYYFKEDSKKA